MKSLKYFLLAISLFIINNSYSQDPLIELNNTSISNPPVYDFGKIDSAVYVKYMIKNNRNSNVVVSDIKTPVGFFASISNMTIAAGKKEILYVGLDPNYVDFKGAFEKDVIIKTNLVMDIVVKVKGVVIKK